MIFRFLKHSLEENLHFNFVAIKIKTQAIHIHELIAIDFEYLENLFDSHTILVINIKDVYIPKYS